MSSGITRPDVPAPRQPPSGDLPPTGGDGSGRPTLRALAVLRDYGVVVSLVVLIIVLALTAKNFLTTGNLLNVLDQSTYLGIIAAAGTLVIVSGAFDLSVAGTFALAGVIAARLAVGGMDPTLALVIGGLSGGVVGVFNGLFVARVGINPFITTLATGFIVSGVALVVTGGSLVLVTNVSFSSIGTAQLGSVTWESIIFLIWAAIMALLLGRSVFGRFIYACGGNEEAARLAGIRVTAVRTLTFVLSGLAASLAGILSASRVTTGQADAGQGLQLTAVAAVVVGGTSIWGGSGAVWRTMVGIFLLGLVSNGFDLLSINQVWEQVVFGGIVLLAATVDAQLRRGRG
ncbi:MAG: ABC transporter permease [Solirubrobacteraceae bacterium]